MAAIVLIWRTGGRFFKPTLRKGAKVTRIRIRDRHEQAGTWKNRQQITIMKWDMSEATLHG